jgi:lambda repressor-like predicted transcriptional regulator
MITYGVGLILISPLSSKGFDLESLPTPNRVRSETLKVALTPYSPGKSTL